MDSKIWHQPRLPLGQNTVSVSEVSVQSSSTIAASVTHDSRRIASDNATNDIALFPNHFPPSQNQLQELKYVHMQKQPNNHYTMQVPAFGQQQQLPYLPQHYFIAKHDVLNIERVNNKYEKPPVVPYLHGNDVSINTNVATFRESLTYLNLDTAYQHQFLPDQAGHHYPILMAKNEFVAPLSEVSQTTCYALKASYEGQLYVATFLNPAMFSNDVRPVFPLINKMQLYVNVIEAVPDMLKDIRPKSVDFETVVIAPFTFGRNGIPCHLNHLNNDPKFIRVNKQRFRSFNWSRLVRRNCHIAGSSERPMILSAQSENVRNERSEILHMPFFNSQHHPSDAYKTYANILQDSEYRHDITSMVLYKFQRTNNNNSINYNLEYSETISDSVRRKDVRSPMVPEEECKEKSYLQHINEDNVSDSSSKKFCEMAEAFCLQQLENLVFFRTCKPYDPSEKRMPYTEMLCCRFQIKTNNLTNSDDAAMKLNNVNLNNQQVFASIAENRDTLKLLQKLRRKGNGKDNATRDVYSWKCNQRNFNRRAT